MHELSIMMNIVDIAEEQVHKASASSVDRIEIEIGQLAGVEMDAFDFAWEIAIDKTVLQHAEKVIHRIEGKARCTECETEFQMSELFDPCPNCGSYFSNLLAGKELRVKSLVVS
jgi:hydrogenase nickel incorporation protein HypA/HybF